MSDDSRQLRIAIFTDSFLPMISGVVTATLTLAEQLAGRGHFVLIVAPGPKKKLRISQNIRVETILSIPAGFYQDFKWSSPISLRIREIVREERIQLVHFMTPFFVSFNGINIARYLDLPLIGTFHTFISDPSNYRHFIKNTLFDVSPQSVWQYSNLYYNAADINTAPAQSTRREMQANGSTVEIKVVSNGIVPSLFDNSQAPQFRKRWKLEGKTLLYTGRVSQDKNLMCLIDVFERIYKQVPEAQLLIIGDGPQLEELTSRAAGSPASSRIIFTGRISHDTLLTSGVFGAVELFITPSKTENQPMTILEVQANGIPCIGFGVRGIPDLITDGVNGRVIPEDDLQAMADAASALLHDGEARRRMSAETMRLVAPHLIDNVIDRWETIYREVISTYRSGGYPRKGFLHFSSFLHLLKSIHIAKPADHSVRRKSGRKG